MQYDFILVGQGIAGSLLAYTLIKRGKKVLVFNSPQHSSATRVAAGLLNPFTGKHLQKTWLAEALFPYLNRFYPMLEQEIGQRFFFPRIIYRPYRSTQEQNDWVARSLQFGQWLRTDTDEGYYQQYVQAPLGGLETLHGGYIDTNKLLDGLKAYLHKQEAYQERSFAVQQLRLHHEGVEYLDYKANYVIFCEGAHACQNPFFSWLPFKPVKGEILHIQLKVALSFIPNQGVSVVCHPDGFAKVAATYQWEPLDEQISQAARQALTDQSLHILKVPFSVVGQQAGIRPATRSRRPFIGLHPQYRQIGIFNGFGSKGLSLAPFFAKEFYEYIEYRKPLNPAVDILQYFA